MLSLNSPRKQCAVPSRSTCAFCLQHGDASDLSMSVLFDILTTRRQPLASRRNSATREVDSARTSIADRAVLRYGMHCYHLHSQTDTGSVHCPVEICSPGKIAQLAAATAFVQSQYRFHLQVRFPLSRPIRKFSDEELQASTVRRLCVTIWVETTTTISLCTALCAAFIEHPTQVSRRRARYMIIPSALRGRG